jgi:hypothetical protein
MYAILGAIGVASLVAIPFYFSSKKMRRKLGDNWGDSHNPSGEVTGAVEAGLNAIEPGSQLNIDN